MVANAQTSQRSRRRRDVAVARSRFIVGRSVVALALALSSTSDASPESSHQVRMLTRPSRQIADNNNRWINFFQGKKNDDKGSREQSKKRDLVLLRRQQDKQRLPRTSSGRRSLSVPLVVPRIINGNSASIGEYPYFASRWSSSTVCGASLIAPDLLLTAAHCQSTFATDAVVGAYIPDKTDAGAQVVTVTQQFPHPRYTSDEVTEGLANDIMLLKISPSVDSKSPIELNLDTSIPVDDAQLTVIGMGKTSDAANSYSSVLLETQVTKVSDAQCDQDWGNGVAHTFLCAWNEKPTRRTICSGDSGGPLIDSTPDPLQVGIVSFGEDFCVNGTASAGYTRVSAYKDWLTKTICDESASPPAYLSCPLSGYTPPTQGPTTTLPHCDNPSVCQPPSGLNYRGCVRKTAGGIPCQPWASQSPHVHDYGAISEQERASMGLYENYCRNPDNDPKGVWCFTTDPDLNWDYCAVDECMNGGTTASPTASPSFQPTSKPIASTSAPSPRPATLESTATSAPITPTKPSERPSASPSTEAPTKAPTLAPTPPRAVPIPACADRDQPCSSSTPCCSDDICTGLVAFGSSATACKKCAKRSHQCTETSDCCGAMKRSKCNDSGICVKCAGKHKACNSPSDCCHEIAVCQHGSSMMTPSPAMMAGISMIMTKAGLKICSM